MSVPDQETSYFYTANGVTTTFAYQCYVLLEGDLDVYLDGVLQTSGYTVTGLGNQGGGTVVFGVAPANGVEVSLLRDLPLERETDYAPLGDLNSDTVDNDFDRLWMALQGKTRDNFRAIRYRQTESLDGTLPSAAARANMLLGFDLAGFQTMVPLPASVGAGDLRDDTFVEGVNFTGGVTVQLTLSRDPGAAANVSVHFDGVYQGPDQWSVAGDKLNFLSPIPVGVTRVYVRTGTTLSFPTLPPGSIDDADVGVLQPFVSARSTTGHDKNLERVSALDFMTQAERDAIRAGTTVENPTANLQAAINEVCGTGKLLVLPDGFYYVDALTIDARNGGGICAENPGGAIFLPRSNGVTALTVANQQLGSPRRPFYIRGIGFNSNSKPGYVCVSSTNSLQLNVLDCWSYQVDYVIKVIAPNGGPNAYCVNLDGWNQYGKGSWDFDGQGTARVFQINIANVNQFSVGASGWVAPWFRFRRVINANMVNVVSQSLDGEAAGIVGLGAIEGLFLSNVLVVWPTDGITLAQDGDVKPPSYIYLNNVAVDQEAGIGINVGAEVFKAVNTNVTGGLFRTNTGPAWVIQNYTRDWIMIGCTIRDNYRSGLTVNNGCADGMVIGCVLRDNVALPASGFDLDIGVTAHNDPILIGNRIDTQSVSGPQFVNDGYSSDFLFADRAQSATIANTVETTLASYTLPANAFQGSMSLELETSGVLGANANNKTIRLYIAGVQVAIIATNGNGISWRMEAKVYRISATQAWAQITTYAGATVNVSSAIIALDSTVNTGFQLTGQNGTAAANDIVKHHFDVKRIR